MFATLAPEPTARALDFIPRRGVVHFGSIDVPRKAAGAFAEAASYLCRDAVMRGVLERAERASRPLHLRVNSHDDDSYDPCTRTIDWDPYSALRTTGGGRQSPALGLGHELDHAAVDGRLRTRGSHSLDSAYDNAEERRVICGSEAHAARTLGEDVRFDHDGAPYRVASPLER